MRLENIPLNAAGILQLNDARFVIKPVELERKVGERPILTAAIIDELLPASYGLTAQRIGRNPEIKKVIFSDPATVVMWSDGTKTVVKCQPGDTYSKETGLALCIAKKYLGNKGNFNEVFKKWIPEDEIPVDEMREALKSHCYLRHCRNCLVDKRLPNHRCGNGTLFGVKKPDGSYDMTDDEVRAAYKVAFKED